VKLRCIEKNDLPYVFAILVISMYSGIVVQSDIYDVIRQVFTAATAQLPPKGIGHSPQSRAIYGIDVMLQWKTFGQSGKLIVCRFSLA